MKGLKKAEQQPLLEMFRKHAPVSVDNGSEATEPAAVTSTARRQGLPKKSNIRQLEKLLKRFQ